MDFKDSPEEATFRAEVRDWLKGNAPGFALSATTSEIEAHNLGRAWQACKSGAGYAGFTLPRELGGRGGTMIEQIIFQAEEAKYPLPPANAFIEGWGVVLPVVAKHGTPEQYERFGAPTLRGEQVWCQLFSEPSGGSDAASIRTRAVRDGDDWVVNGQKVWSSDAHLSDWGLLLARTDPGVAKHKGLTMFLLDMRSAGIEVRPICKINGDSEFNEVFFTDVRLPDAMRVGEVDGGWKVAHTTFNAEHSAFSGAPAVIHDVFDPLMRVAGRVAGTDGRPLIESAAVRAVLADYYVTFKAVEFMRYRQYTALAKGGQPGVESAISKLALGRLMQNIGALGMDMGGPAALVNGASADQDLQEFQKAFLVGAELRIAGGTDEILLNNIAERVLGMPGDLRVDKDIPFKDIPVGPM